MTDDGVTRNPDARCAVVASMLFEPLSLRDVTFRNRIGVSPMCQYSCDNGYTTDWHLVHLGSRAVGGAGLVMVEASAVTADGRISPHDVGIYEDGHIERLARIASFVSGQGAVPAIQIAHAGRKASTAQPWKGGGYLSVAEGGWSPIFAPSALPFGDHAIVPKAMDEVEIGRIVRAFADAAERALTAGFRVVELHGAHGYLMHEFLSPLVNHRTDAYGGSFENRTRFARDVVTAVRRVWPERLPLFLRVSASDWVDGGWTVEDSVELARMVKPLGVDLIDASSGGAVPDAVIALGPGYQVPFAAQIRREAQIPTAAVGLITTPEQAEGIVADGEADMVFLAREELRDPYFPLHAAHALDVDVAWPEQYQRAKPRRTVPA